VEYYENKNKKRKKKGESIKGNKVKKRLEGKVLEFRV